MFNNDVTQTHNFQDASFEIIFMLLGAFLLGCLLTWLLHKLFNRDYSVENSDYRYDNNGNDEINTLKQTHQAQTTGDVKIVDKPTQQQARIVTAPDDLTKISGIDKKMQTALSTYNIKSFADLRDIKTKDLKSIQNNQQVQKREVETWPHQASLAVKGEWNKLKDYQGFIQRVQVASNSTEETKSENYKHIDKDELTKVVGINSEIETILNNKEIHTFKQLSHIDSEILKSHLVEENSIFEDRETESWPHQAAMADKEQWDELKVYQEFMHSDSEPEESNKNTSIQAVSDLQNTNMSVPKVTNLGEANDKDEPIKENSEQNLSDHDDLKKIEGIGPKIEEVLNGGGIYTYSQLYNSNKERLRQLLDDAGSQFRMHNPESWPHQAGMADRSEWDELQTYKQTIIQEQAHDAKQIVKRLRNEGDTTNTNISESNNEYQTDDLRKIEGIGPKIEKVLNGGGINTYNHLYNSNSEILRQLLDDAGNQFRMHNPESWPHQAGMANRSEWDELKTYQHTLIQEQVLKAKASKKEQHPKKSSARKDASKLNTVSNIDDLRKIEGIGPKIQELLNNAGIETFKALSENSRDSIKKLLNEAGPQFRVHEPESWPHQAKLAADGDWDELAKYQDFLSGGRE